MENFIIQLLQRPRLALDSCSQMNWHWKCWLKLTWHCEDLGWRWGLVRQMFAQAPGKSWNRAVATPEHWLDKCFELVCFWIGVPGFVRSKNWFCYYVSLLGNFGLFEDGTQRVHEWAIDCDDIDSESKNHRDDARNLFAAALNAFQPFRKFACMRRSWSSNREKMHIWVNCYCWGNSSMAEGQFSKWF